MNINIDSAIFVGFLIVTLIAGLLSSRGTNNIKEYAIGDRNFSTATIVATIVATWISGDFFYVTISEAYTVGLNHIWVAVLGDFFALLFVGLIFAPRMGEFLGTLSIADAMGNLYGDRVRIVTSVSAFVGALGAIAIELKLAGLIFEYALDIPSTYGVIVATIIVTLYSALGGIKSVTFTDIIQFFTFGVVIPVTAYVLLTSINNIEIISDTLTTSPLFDYKKVFDFSNPLALKQLFIFLFFIIPPFGPAIFQRVAMAKNTDQVNKSFIIAAITCLLFAGIVSWIAILTLSINPFLSPTDAIKEVIFNSSYVGLKGAMLAGIMAMIMSTVDSYINSTAVIIVHDFCKPLKLKLLRNELFSARIVSILIGASTLILSLRDNSLLELIVITCSLYMPIVTMPFIMAILGFRSTEKSVLIGMGAGLTTVVIWDYLLQITAVNSVFLGMLANLIFLVGSHYLLKQKGGWIGIKDVTPLINIRKERRHKLKRFFASIRSFNLLNICKKNCPRGEGLISILGLFVMISTFSTTHTLNKEYQLNYSFLINSLYPMSLCASAVLISYPLWLPSWKNTNLIVIFWNIIMFSVLICFSFLLILINLSFA